MLEKLKSFLTFSNIRILACVILCAIGFVAFGTSQIDSIRSENALAEYQVQYETLQKEYANVEVSTAMTEQDAAKEIHSASVAGTDIAELQSAYSHLQSDSDQFEETYLKIDSYLSPNDKNFRVPWYGGVSFDYVWQFCSTYDFEGDSLPCIWLCYESSGNTTVGPVLAYATALYSPATNTFSNVNYRMTYDGAQLIETT